MDEKMLILPISGMTRHPLVDATICAVTGQTCIDALQ
jgi:hypothetical protein